MDRHELAVDAVLRSTVDGQLPAFVPCLLCGQTFAVTCDPPRLVDDPESLVVDAYLRHRTVECPYSAV